MADHPHHHQGQARPAAWPARPASSMRKKEKKAQKNKIQMGRVSGVQKQVLSLYRDGLRRARQLPDASSRGAAKIFISREFRRGAFEVDRLDFQRIEHLLRQGKKKLESLSISDGFRVV